MDILSTIESKLPSLSKGQKRIGQYILDEFDKAAFMTAAAIGKAVQVSESTVVRFASELGYQGYPQMQKVLQEMLLNRLTNVQRIESEHIRLSEENVLALTLADDAERIRQTRELIDHKNFDAAVDAISNARKIFVLGVRSSSALAGFLAYYLRYIFDDIKLITSASTSVILEELVRMGPQDVLISISFPRYCRGVLQAQEYAKDIGACTIALTDSGSSPLALHADHLLVAKSDIISLVESLAAPMSVINAIIAALANKNRQKITQVLNKLEDLWDAYDIYEKFDE